MVKIVLKCPLRRLQHLCVPQVKGPPYLPSLQVHAAQTLPTHRNLLRYPPGPQHPPCSAPGTLLRDSVLPLSQGLILLVGLGRTGNTHSGGITSAHQGRQAQGTGGETRGALSRASQRPLQGRDRGARLHCPGTSHSPTSALAKLICLSRSSGIIFPLEKKTEWVEK